MQSKLHRYKRNKNPSADSENNSKGIIKNISKGKKQNKKQSKFYKKGNPTHKTKALGWPLSARPILEPTQLLGWSAEAGQCSVSSSKTGAEPRGPTALPSFPPLQTSTLSDRLRFAACR